MSLSTNTTYRVYVEKLGASDPTQFVGDEGELFYDPSSPSLFLSDGSTPGGVPVAGGGGGQWTTSGAGIYYDGGNVAIGGPVSAGSTVLMVHGDARVTGILSVGNATITLDPNTNTITADNFAIGAGVTTVDTGKWILTYAKAGIQTNATYTWSSSARFDSQGKIYMNGANQFYSPASGSFTRPYVAKFDNDGTIIWQKFFEADETRAYMSCEALAVDKNSDEIYVSVNPDDNVRSAILVKLNSDGDILWQQEVDDVNDEAGVSIAVASNGNVYLGAITTSQGAGGWEFLVVKFDSDGNEIWQRTIGNVVAQYTGQVAVDSDENVYCTFESYTEGYGSALLVLVKLDSDGNELWQKYVDSDPNNGNYEFGYGVAVDSQNNPYVVSALDIPNSDPNDVGLTKFDSDGNLVWQRSFEKAGDQDGIAIAIDENDKIYIHSYQGTFSGYSISSFDSDGNLLWNKDITPLSGNLDWYWYWGVNYLDVYNGQLALSGYYYNGNIDNDRAFLMRIPTSGENVEGYYGNFRIESSNPVVSISTYTVGISTLTVGISTIPISAAGLTPASIDGTISAEVFYKGSYSYVANAAFDKISTQDFTLNGLRFGKSNGYASNFIVGSNAGGCSYSSHNNFIGYNAGGSTIFGSYNNFLGGNAGAYNTNGSSNNFIGYNAGMKNIFGSGNNFFGQYAGCKNNGSHNNFFGSNAGREGSNGGDNNFFGRNAGLFNEGNDNIFIGQQSGYPNTGGSKNIFLGSYSGISTNNSYKVVIGSGANYQNRFDAPDTENSYQMAIGVNFGGSSNYWLVGNSSFNVGIGTTNPTKKLHVGGDVKVGVDTSQGIVLTDSNGVEWRLSVNTNGTLAITSV